MTFHTPVGSSTTELQETRGSLGHITRFKCDKIRLVLKGDSTSILCFASVASTPRHVHTVQHHDCARQCCARLPKCYRSRITFQFCKIARNILLAVVSAALRAMVWHNYKPFSATFFSSGNKSNSCGLFSLSSACHRHFGYIIIIVNIRTCARALLLDKLEIYVYRHSVKIVDLLDTVTAE